MGVQLQQLLGGAWRMFISRLSLTVLVLLVSTSLVSAGFRCTLGEWACSASCVTLGQTSGICDSESDCICSEKSISLSNLRKLLPSRCNLGEGFCSATCNTIGRSGGKCLEDANDCECSDTYLSPTQFALCAAESTCRLDCQRQGKATGECVGWQCLCKSTDDATLPPEFEDIKADE